MNQVMNCSLSTLDDAFATSRKLGVISDIIIDDGTKSMVEAVLDAVSEDIPLQILELSDRVHISKDNKIKTIKIKKS